MPNGSLWKQKRPNGVIKVVNNAESGDRGICQKPELASSLETMVAPESWARTWSTDGRGCHSRLTFSLSLDIFVLSHLVLVRLPFPRISLSVVPPLR